MEKHLNAIAGQRGTARYGSQRRHRCLVLVLVCALATSGCGTICHPERSLLHPYQRGGLDWVVVVLDILLSAPTIVLGAFGRAGGPNAWEILFAPLWVDWRQGTLWHPKEGDPHAGDP